MGKQVVCMFMSVHFSKYWYVYGKVCMFMLCVFVYVVCMCLYILFVCLYLNVYVCMYLYMLFVCLYLNAYVCMYLYMLFVCLCLYVSVYTYPSVTVYFKATKSHLLQTLNIGRKYTQC